MIHPFEGESGGHRAIADHGHDFAVVFSLVFCRHCHAKRGADGSGRMADAKVSYSLSYRFGKPLSPLYLRFVEKLSRRPVRILCP